MTRGWFFRNSSRRVCAAIVVVYLSIGVAFATNTMPEQTWRCPDVEAPSGEVTYGGTSRPPRNDCWATVSVGDRLGWFAFGTPAWLPLAAAKALAT